MNDSGKQRLLIVDDEEGMRMTLRRIMVAKGYEVAVAANGHEAIKQAKHFRPQIVLMDIRMPGLNGVETYRQIKALCPTASPIFMTAYSTSELSQEAMDEGAIEVMAKPLDIDNLCRIVAQSGSSRPVLIVDDDPGFRESLERALTAVGFQVYTAGGAEDALTEFRRHPNCVAVLDMKLNGISGLQVFEQFRKLNKDAVALLMTGFAEFQSEMQTGLSNGACNTFVKPFDVDQLADQIRACV